MIDVQNLVKQYGAKRAVDEVSFSVEKGEIVGLLGPNGAGKTTTMNIMTGYTAATRGSVSIGGADIMEQPMQAKSQIGYLPEHPPLYLDMTVSEYLNFVFELKRVSKPRSSHISEVCEMVRIGDVRGRLIKNLSKGYRQRVGLAQALLGNPPCLILDEPTVGLDPKQIWEIRELIRKLGESRTIILSSHILAEVSAVAQRLLIINKGKLVAQGTTDDLSSSVENPNRFTVRIEGNGEQVLEKLRSINGMTHVEIKDTVSDKVNDLVFDGVCDLRREVFTTVAGMDAAILLLKPDNLTLEEIFIRLTTHDDLTTDQQEEDPEADGDVQGDELAQWEDETEADDHEQSDEITQQEES